MKSFLLGVVMVATASSAVVAQDGTAKALAPTKLWAAQTSDKFITLTWTPAKGASGYRLFRCSGIVRELCAAAPTIARLAANVASNLQPFIGAAPVTFFLQAIGPNGDYLGAVPFNPVTPLAKDVVADIPPKTSSVTATQTGNAITLTWQPVDGATAYAIGRAVAPYGFQTRCRLCSTETRFVDSAITAGAKHTYSVSAITPRGVSRGTLSNVVTPSVSGVIDSAKATIGDTTKTAIPVDSAKASILPPSMFQVVLSALGAAQLRWAGSANAKGYYLYRSVAGGPFVRIAALGNTATSFTDALAGVFGQIRYRIAAYDAKGPSPVVETSVEKAGAKGATVDSAKASILPPSMFQVILSALGAAQLTWAGSANAKGYYVERSVNGGPFVRVGVLGGTTLSFIDRLEGIVGQVRYRLAAYDAKGASPYVEVSVDKSAAKSGTKQ